MSVMANVENDSTDDVPLEAVQLPEGEAATIEIGEENIEGDSAGVEAEPTSLPPEGVSEPNINPLELTEDTIELPLTLLPAPLHLDSHPADTLHPPDSPTTSLITSLRSQLTSLSRQSDELNTKLVASISRHADLEDQHEALQSQHKTLEERAGELARSKKQWEESMSAGVLVERSQIRDEMQKLAAGLVEEERRRGSAEERRQKVEGEVDALTASLFDQANTMVAAERMGRILAEERLKNAEDNLMAAEAAVRDMQLHLQSLPASAVPNLESQGSALRPQRYLSSHIPYTEFTTFLQSLRSLRPLKDKTKELLPPPLITTLLGQPFVARAIIEDHDPTLRLDVAPTLSWLTRKGVSQAIIAGDLVIEPVSASTIIANSSSAIDAIACSLCGKPVFAPTVPQSPASSQFGQPPSHPTQRTTSSSRFSLKPFFNSSSPSQTVASPTQSPLASPGLGQTRFTMSSVYVFRVAANQPGDKEPRSYPLCKSGCCLERLRATCQLWYFIRTGIIHVIWHGEDSRSLAPETSDPTPLDRVRSESVELEATPLPVTRKSGWGLGFKLADKNGSGSWTKAFNRSTPGSPTVEKRSDQVETAEEAVPLDEKSGGEEGLGAPLELDKENDQAQNVVPMIHEPQPSPMVATSTRVEPATTVEEDDTLQTLRSRRSGSTPSLNGTDDGASFSTPKGINPDLPEEPDAENGLPVSTDVPRSEVVELASPKAETSSGSRAIAPTLSKDRLPPPPIPRRAAARDRLGQSDGSGSSRSSFEGRSPISTAEGESSTESRHSEELEKTSSVETVSESSSAEDMTESQLDSQASGPPKLPIRPPLPPRNPRTPTAQIAEPTSDGHKTYLIGDGWDVKTWKHVIRLKEEMWRARVGVIIDRAD